MLEWEWADNPNTAWLFITILLLASHEDGAWKGVDVKRGQAITSRARLSAQTGLSEQSVRTALKNLLSTNEITIESTNNFTIITICKYDSYQQNQEDSNQQINQQTTSQLTSELTTSEEEKNIISSSSPRDCARTREIPVDEISYYIDSLKGTQQYESVQRAIYRLTEKIPTPQELATYTGLFTDELHIQGQETHETKDICRHFIQWARIAIPQINNSKNNGNTKANTRQDIIDSYRDSIIEDLQAAGIGCY